MFQFSARTFEHIRRAGSRRPIVIIQEAPKTRAAANPATGLRRAPILNERVLESLMIPLAMIVLEELGHGPSQMALAEQDRPVETFVSNRPRKTFGVGIRIGRLERRLHDVRE